MKFQVERESFANAVAHVAKGLPTRPAVPVLACIHITATEESGNSVLRLSSFDYEVGTVTTAQAQVDEGGNVLVSGKLLTEIAKALPKKPVEIASTGTHVEITCGSARFTLPTMPVEDYPQLPEFPPVIGSAQAESFAHAVSQVAVAAGRDDTLPMLMGVYIEMHPTHLAMMATDRYRLAIRELPWDPAEALETSENTPNSLVPARILHDAAKALAARESITLALSTPDSGASLIGFSAEESHTTARLLDGEFPNVTALLPASYTATAVCDAAELTSVVKRVSLVAERETPIRFTFTPDTVTVEAGGSENAQASESLPATFDGEELTIAFNPAYLLDGVGAIGRDRIRLSFTEATKPVVLTGVHAESGREEAMYRYVLMPVRIAG